jgi:hypothetical protein
LGVTGKVWLSLTKSSPFSVIYKEEIGVWFQGFAVRIRDKDIPTSNWDKVIYVLVFTDPALVQTLFISV